MGRWMGRVSLMLLLVVLFTAGCASNTVITEDIPAPTIMFCPQDDCEELWLNLTKDASSLDCAFFDLDLESMIDRLKEKNARVVVDGNQIKSLQGYDFIRFDNNNQYSHNKFCVINETVVWTGSMNPTSNGVEKNNNNVIVYKSKYLASNYQSEFEELWGGKFGGGNKVKYRQIENSRGSITNLFCPEDDCKEEVIQVLESAQESIYFMTFSFTDREIAEVLVKNSKLGLDVKGVMEKRRINMKHNMFHYLEDNGVDVVPDENRGVMHHKVFIVDGRIVITGSYNPTKSGDSRNDENLLIIEDESAASRYLEEFERLVQ